MRRFWMEPQPWQDDQMEVRGDLYHHLHDVCRFQVGERFELLETGRAWLVELIRVDKKSLGLKRIEERQLPKLNRPYIHLVLSCPRFSTVDWIVEKSVELGVYSIQLVVSDFSFVRDLKGVPAAKMERWQKLIRQASQQSARGHLLELPPVRKMMDVLGEVNHQTGVLSLFPYEGAGDMTLKAALGQARQQKYSEIYVFIGSEGGFSKPEVEQFRRAGLAPVTLGSQVLRVETACLALASILKYEFEHADEGQGAPVHGSI